MPLDGYPVTQEQVPKHLRANTKCPNTVVWTSGVNCFWLECCWYYS